MKQIDIVSKMRLIHLYSVAILLLCHLAPNLAFRKFVIAENLLVSDRRKAVRGLPLQPQLERSTELRLLPEASNVLTSIASYDLKVSLFVSLETLVFIKGLTSLATKEIVEPVLSRKLLHTFSGPLLLMHWPLYSGSPFASYAAALIPLLQIARLISAGSGTGRESELVRAVSRSGMKKEALQGPFIYTVVLVVATLAFFRGSPVGIVAVAQMAVGDGLSDIIGRRWGTVKLPFSPRKSLQGSLAFVVGAFLATTGLLYFISALGFPAVLGPQSLGIFSVDLVAKILFISLACAAVESIPATYLDDNISVPIAAAVLTHFLL